MFSILYNNSSSIAFMFNLLFADVLNLEESLLFEKGLRVMDLSINVMRNMWINMTCPCSLPQQVSMVSQSSFSPISHFYESSEIYSTDHFLNSGMKSSLLTPYLGCYLPFPCVLVLPFLHLKADVIIVICHFAFISVM